MERKRAQKTFERDGIHRAMHFCGQFKSATEGFTMQIKGVLTKKLYHLATKKLTKMLSHTQEGKNMEVNSNSHAEIYQREGTDIPNNDIPNNDNKQGTDSIMGELPDITEIGQAELAESDQDMVTTSNYSE